MQEISYKTEINGERVGWSYTQDRAMEELSFYRNMLKLTYKDVIKIYEVTSDMDTMYLNEEVVWTGTLKDIESWDR